MSIINLVSVTPYHPGSVPDDIDVSIMGLSVLDYLYITLNTEGKGRLFLSLILDWRSISNSIVLNQDWSSLEHSFNHNYSTNYPNRDKVTRNRFIQFQSGTLKV